MSALPPGALRCFLSRCDTFFYILMPLLILATFFPSKSFAGQIVKADNTTMMNILASWVGPALPLIGDTAVFNSTLATTASCAINANRSWGGIRVADPALAYTITTNGKTITIGAGGMDLSAATKDFTFSENLTLGAAQTWTVASGRTLTISPPSAVAGGANAITVAGSGKVVCSGGMTNTSTLAINGGTLQINSACSWSGGVTVNTGGTLAGTNTLTGAVSAPGGAIAPGNSGIGKLSITGNLTLSTSSILNIELGATTCDTINITGALTADGTVNFSGSPANGTYTFMKYSGALTDAVINVGNVPSGKNCSVTASSGSVTVTVTTANLGAVAGAGNALDLDGSDDYLDIPNVSALNPTTALTMECWVKLANPSANQKILSKYDLTNGYMLGVEFGQLYPEVKDAGGTMRDFHAGTIPANTWTHLAVTYTASGNIVGYVNGTQVYSAAVGAFNVSSNSIPLRIGAAGWDAAAFHSPAQVDEVRIWNTARTQAEIQNNMHTPLVGSESGLVGYWRFDETAGSSVKDWSSSASSALMYNMDNSDWVASGAWSSPAATEETALTKSAGYDPMGVSNAFTSMSELTGPSNGSVSYNATNRTYTYTPASNFVGTDAFTFRTYNGYGYDTCTINPVVANTNDAPTGVAISNAAIWESLASGTLVGCFSSTDPDPSDSYTYTLVTGTGSTDNASFSISGNQLLSAAIFNYAAKSSYSVRIRTTDAGGLYTEQAFTIAILQSGRSPVAGSGTALSFNGSTNYTVAPHSSSLNISGQLTMECWVYCTNPSQNQKLISKFNLDPSGYLLGINGGGLYPEVRGASGSTVQFTSGTIPANTWTHLAVTYDPSGSLIGYINGIQVNSVAASGTIVTNTNNLHIGTPSWNAGVEYMLGGKIDEVRIWDVVRTESQIQNAMYTPLVGNESNLVAYYPFDEGTGSVVFDKTANNNDMPLTKYTTSGWTNSTAWRSRATATGVALTTAAGYDPDAPASSLGLIAQVVAPSHGTFSGTLANNTYTYTPTGGYTGVDTFSYAVWDYTALDTFSVSVNIAAVNSAPTDVLISNAVMDAGIAANTTVGTLSTSDVNGGDTHTYSLVSGTGATHNSYFTISGTALRTASMLTCDIDDTFYVRIRTTDQGGLYFEESLPLVLTTGGFDTLAMTLRHLNNNNTNYSGDNTTFKIGGFERGNASPFNDEVLCYVDMSAYAGRAISSASLVITLDNIYNYSSATQTVYAYRQNKGAYNAAAVFNTYALTAWSPNLGSFTNITTLGDFTITSAALATLAKAWADSSSTANGGIVLGSNMGEYYNYFRCSSVKLIVSCGSQPPTALSLTGSTIDEELPAGTYIGKLSTTDPESSTETYTYSFASGTGSTDNAKFAIRHDSLFAGSSLDYETQQTASVRIETHDGNCNRYSAAFTITINNRDDGFRYVPLTVKNNVGAGASDTVLVYTDSFSLIFDEDNGGGIKWLSYAANGGGTNQLASAKSLFGASFSVGSSESSTGAGQIDIVESNQVYCIVQQTKQLGAIPMVIRYTVYGNGTIYVHSVFGSAQSSAVSGATMTYYISRAKNNVIVRRSGTGYLHIGDDGTGQGDLHCSQVGTWTKSTGSIGSSGTNAGDVVTQGFYSGSYALAAGEFDINNFKIDFSHKNWNDTTTPSQLQTADYRAPDSLELIAGTLGYQRAWEEFMRGQWGFDENSADTAFDVSIENRWAKIVDASPSWVAGKVGYGYDFNGTTDSCAINNASGLDNHIQFTAMAWIKKGNTTDADAIIIGEKGTTGSSGWKFGTVSNYLSVTVYGKTLTGATALGTGWHHVACSYDKHTADLRLYLDGKIEARATTQNVPSATGPLNPSIGKTFTGTLDDVRFYAKAIPETVVEGIYNRGFRSAEGMYMVRANNNNTMHLRIDGSSTAYRSQPVLQVSNYWLNTAPAAIAVNGVFLTSGQDYVAYVNTAWHTLYIAFNAIIQSPGTYIYLDNNDQLGASQAEQMPQMSWSKYTDAGGVPCVSVKNFSGNTFGTATSNQYYMNWKMHADTNKARMGELWFMQASKTRAGLAVDTSATNLLPGTDDIYRSTFGSYAQWFGTWTNENASTRHVRNGIQYAIVESSLTRVVLSMGPRFLANGTDTTKMYTQWTLYPTGQMYRYDSVYVMKRNGIGIWQAFFLDKVEDPTIYLDTFKTAGVLTGCASIPDFAVASMGIKNLRGYVGPTSGPFSWGNQQVVNGTGASRAGFEFTQQYNPLLRFGSDSLPFMLSWYIDLQKQSGMNAAYLDSVVKGVQGITIADADMISGTLNKTTPGDLNQDGFCEREGAYCFTASQNRVAFTLKAGSDTVRYHPVIHIYNWTAITKPQYVYLYSATDTLLLAERYGYNCYYNNAGDEVVIQLDTILRNNTKIYISYDVNLAVDLSQFEVRAGDTRDTVVWRTESESENLGFHLWRRVAPSFYDSVKVIADTVSDSAGPAVTLMRKGSVAVDDTLWTRITPRMIPGADGGTSVGPRDYRYLDEGLQNHIRYEYRLEAIDFGANKKQVGPIAAMPMPMHPGMFMLYANYPNPFRGITNIRFDMPVAAPISLRIYDLRGRMLTELIRTDMRLPAGYHAVQWDGRTADGAELASGPYIYRIVVPGHGYSKSQVMMLVR